MKLTNISINEFSQGRNLDLNNLSTGLNVIFGANGTGKSSIRRFLRGMLLNMHGVAGQSGLHGDLANFGSLDVLDRSQQQRMAYRNLSSGPRFHVESLENYPASPNGLKQLPQYFDCDTYDQILNIDFGDLPDEVHSLVSVLINRLGVKRGNIEKPPLDMATIRQRELTLANVRDLIAELNRRSEHLSRQIAERNRGNLAEIESLSRHITDLSDRIAALESAIAASRNRIRDLDIEIDDLRLQIEQLRNQVHFIKLRKDTSRLPELLAQLEALDQQIARWRKVQHDVQSQRNKLRDELAGWESEDRDGREELPFAESRELLNSLEQRVSELDAYINRVQRVIPHRAGEPLAATIAGSMQKTLTSMREEVYQLCRELNAQHLVFRRKAVVNELKQLRRCFVEVSDHLQRLAARRATLIQEIAKFDPARADLILSGQFDLRAGGDHGQQLRGRPMDEYAEYGDRRVDVDVDVSSELARLQQIENDRERLQAEVESSSIDLHDLIRRRHELLQRRESLKISDVNALRRELVEVARRLPEEKQRFAELQRQLEIDRQAASYRPNILLEQAGRHLQRMSRGDLTRIWISESTNDLITLDNNGRTIGYAALSRSGKDQIRLAISLAAVSALATQGMFVPLVLDEPFVNLDDDALRRGAEVLLEFCQTDRQVILFTCRRYVVDLLTRPGVAVLDLPDYHFSETKTPTHRYAAAIDAADVGLIDGDYPAALPTIDSTLNLYGEGHVYDYIEPQVMTTETLVETARYLYDEPAAETSAAMTETLAEIAERPPRQPQARPREIVSVVEAGTHLTETRLMGNDNIARLRRIGIRTVGDLLNFDPQAKHAAVAEEDLEAEDIEAWQSQALLLIGIPQLRATDALMLYGCGIHHPETLASIELHDLETRIGQFADTTRGSRMLNSGYSYDTGRLKTWINAARANRDLYASRELVGRTQPGRNGCAVEPDQAVSSSIEDRSAAEAVAAGLRGSTNPARRPLSTATTGRSAKKAEPSNSAGTSAVKFYLDLSSGIESAPSIGPRTGERLEKIGIATVKDLLETPAQDIAASLDYKRIKLDDIRAWQQQATLVCRVPQLRGHDAQFLVACGITEPEQLAAMDPQELYKIIGPFAKTSEGQKISRAGKNPDLAEVTDWINWSQQTRMLKAG